MSRAGGLGRLVSIMKRLRDPVSGCEWDSVQTFERIPDVDQAFGGVFTADSPAPDRTNPKCEKGTPPPWVGNAEKVSFGG